MERILVIEDESDIRDLICWSLEKEGYTAVGAASGEEGLKLLEEREPDLILLDLMLPGIDGFEILRRLRAGGNSSKPRLPVVILSAKGEEDDIVRGLELGADDYIAKPFSPRVLMARLRTRLREIRGEGPAFDGGASDGRTLENSGLFLDPVRHRLRSDEGEIELSATEFALLEFFMSNPGWAFSRAQLIDAVRGPDYPVTDRSVDVQILSLRKKLGSYGSLIETVRGVGYRFKDPQR